MKLRLPSPVYILGAVVVAVMLAGLVLPRVTGTKQRANVGAAKIQINAFGTALNLFKADNGAYPPGTNGLRDLIAQPPNTPNWKRYLDTALIPRDPWGHRYLYCCPGIHNPASYDLLSMGPDGRAGDEDDICNWKND